MELKVAAGRDARTERIGAELFDAARAVFLTEGYHGATLDRIAAEAGYTKGVVYSRFRSKGDLFLALLEARIDARREENHQLAKGRRGVAGFAQLARRWGELQGEDAPWTLLVLEFRVHAARDAALAARYSELHDRTLEGIAEVVEAVLDGDGTPAARKRARRVAQVLHSVGNAASLEQAVDPAAFPPQVVASLARAIAGIGAP